MNASIPKRLLESREFRPLGTLARVVLRGLWRRGEERLWTREELLQELQSRGLFLGRRGLEEFEAVIEEFLASGALRRPTELELDADGTDDHGALYLPILSADRPRDVRSETPAARRKREQRERDRQDPERVAARRAGRHSPSPDAQSAPPSTAPERPAVEPPSARDTGCDISRDMPPLSHLDVTVTGHVTPSVTVTASGGERGGGNSSSSSSSSSEETRHSQGVTAREREGAPGWAPVTPVTGSVTPDVTGSVTPDVTAADLVRALSEHAPHRVNCMAPQRILERATQLLVEQRVTRAELDEMGRKAAKGELMGQDQREVTDLVLLVGGRQGEGGLLTLWVGAARSSLAKTAREMVKSARAQSTRQNDLPYGAGAPGRAPPSTPAAVASTDHPQPLPGRFSPPVVRAGPPHDERRGRQVG